MLPAHAGRVHERGLVDAGAGAGELCAWAGVGCGGGEEVLELVSLGEEVRWTTC